MNTLTEEMTEQAAMAEIHIEPTDNTRSLRFMRQAVIVAGWLVVCALFAAVVKFLGSGADVPGEFGPLSQEHPFHGLAARMSVALAIVLTGTYLIYHLRSLRRK